VDAGKIRAVIDVEHVGYPANVPVETRLAPYRLSKRKRGVQRRWCSEENHVTGDGARIVVDHRREPGPGFFAVRVDDQNVELGVVGLPGRVGPIGAMAMHQLIAVAERRLAFMRERERRGVEPGHDRVNAAIGRRLPAPLVRDRGDPAMNGGG